MKRKDRAHDHDHPFAQCMFCGDDLFENDESYELGGGTPPAGYACKDCVSSINGYEVATERDEMAFDEHCDAAHEAWKQDGVLV